MPRAQTTNNGHTTKTAAILVVLVNKKHWNFGIDDDGLVVFSTFQIYVSGARGVLGQFVPNRAAVESGSATGILWPLPQDPSAGSSRLKARAATRDFARVYRPTLLWSSVFYLHTKGKACHAGIYLKAFVPYGR